MKLCIAVARHNLKWLKILIKWLRALGFKGFSLTCPSTSNDGCATGVVTFSDTGVATFSATGDATAETTGSFTGDATGDGDWNIKVKTNIQV